MLWTQNGLQAGAERLSKDTDFYTIESEGTYSSVLFVTPVTLAGISLGGNRRCLHEERVPRKRLRSTGYAASTSRYFWGVYGALLLWTRIPDRILGVLALLKCRNCSFLILTGSTPMFFFHGKRFKVDSYLLVEDLPRDYF